MIRFDMVTRTLIAPLKMKPKGYRVLDEFLSQQTDLYNGCLEEKFGAYDKTDSSPSCNDQYKSLTVIRNDELIGDEFSRFDAQAQRSAIARADKAYWKWVKEKKDFKDGKSTKKPGKPRYKSKDRGVRSFDLSIKPDRIKRLSKRLNSHGEHTYQIEIKGLEPFKFRETPARMSGEYALIRIVKTAIGSHIHIVSKFDIRPEFRSFAPVGIDVGVKDQVTMSTGESVPGVKRKSKKIKRLQRQLSRAKKGSNSWRKKKESLAKEHEHQRISEHNACHRLTTWLVSKYTHVALENIDRESMIKASPRDLTRRIHEQLWGSIANQLTYKAESAGGEVRRVNPAYTSRTCSKCGWRRPTKLPLSVREFRCKNTECNSVMDRDVNAARNILKRAKFEPPSWYARDSLAGWEIGLPASRPGASENVERGVRSSDALKRQDAELSSIAA